jgi:hypothetical protein
VNEQHPPRGTPHYRRERRFRRQAQMADILLALAGMSPGEVYCGLLWHAHHGAHRPWQKPDGWAAHVFRELYGLWPRPQDRGEPMRPSIKLERWIASRPKKGRRPPAAAETRRRAA